MYFDSHIHLDDERYDSDREDVINKAFIEGVDLILNVGIDLETSKKSIELAKKYNFIYATCGIHPHEAEKATKEDYIKIKDLLSNEKVVGIGEVGLDYYRNISPQNIQKDVFARFIKIAKEVKKPLIVHTRDASFDTMRILEEEGAEDVGGVAHCFSGNIDMVKKLLDMNFYISFSGQVTFKNALNIIKLVKEIPENRLLIETDGPYLAPEPYRGKRNTPVYIKYVAQKIADIKGLSTEDIGRITKVNAIRLFNLSINLKSAYVYPIRDSLYLNITNRCTSSCGFCIKNKNDFTKGHLLRIEREPELEDLIKEIEPNIRKYKEVVFCGYGEPSIRTDFMLDAARVLKKRGVKHIRLNTNGHGNLIAGRNIVPEFTDIIDEVCISLNANNKETYMKVCHPIFGENTFKSVLDFILECKQYVPKVVLTFVDLPCLDMNECIKLAKTMGVEYRIRNLDEVG
ncbi:MAG: YchF/TatD family DNA exonuclease [Candidatus Firestonebacteria bacterium]|nr:YchF/TatD family DNA exonuclease [Candidatus Firestonebacteria bacterium]